MKTLPLALDTNNHILAYQQDALGIITLNRPEALNATSYDMVLDINSALTKFANNKSIKHIAIMSSSERAFCAGGDIRMAYTAMAANNIDLCEIYFRAEYQLVHTLANFQKPIYAFINGLCLGSGMGLSAHCTARIAGENALFGMPETAIGFFPDVGAAYLYNQFNNPSEGMYLALTGNKFNSDHAMRNGIATHKIGESQWQSIIEQLASGVSLEYCAYKTTAVAPTSLCNYIQSAFSYDTLPQIINALPIDALNELKTKSPLSITVTHAYMQRTRNQSLSTVLEQDFALAMNFVRHGEFKEGVRALLVDKDKSPNWCFPWPNSNTMPLIPIEVVQNMFNYTTIRLFPTNEAS